MWSVEEINEPEWKYLQYVISDEERIVTVEVVFSTVEVVF